MIPRKKAYKKVTFKNADVKNKYKKDKYVPLSDDEDEFLDNVKNMQLEDDYEMVDSDDDVLSIGSNESIWWVSVEQDDSIKSSEFNGNKPSLKTIECLASTADILRPQ